MVSNLPLPHLCSFPTVNSSGTALSPFPCLCRGEQNWLWVEREVSRRVQLQRMLWVALEVLSGVTGNNIGGTVGVSPRGWH